MSKLDLVWFMKTVNIHAAKPVARLAPMEKKNVRRTLGMMKGKIRISEDFDAPLPPELLRGFGIE